MSDVQPVPAFAAGGFSASGETSGFTLPPGPVSLVPVVTAVSGTTPSLTVYLDVADGDGWTQAAELTAQTGAGAESASVQPPEGAGPAWRLRWEVSGTGAEFSGQAFAAAS